MKTTAALLIIMSVTVTFFSGIAIGWQLHYDPTPEKQSDSTIATVVVPEKDVRYDYYNDTWYFTSTETGMTVATVSGCPTEDSCALVYWSGAWHVERTTS